MAKKKTNKNQNLKLKETNNKITEKTAVQDKIVEDNFESLSAHIKIVSIILGGLLIGFFFLPWVDYGIDFYSGLGLNLHAKNLPVKIAMDISFNTDFLFIIPLFGLLIAIIGLFKNSSKAWVEIQTEQFGILGFLGSLIFIILTAKFSKYATFGLYLTTLTFIYIFFEGIYLAWRLDKNDNISFIEINDLNSSLYINIGLAVLILLLNYILIPGKLIIGLTQFREFRRH